MGPTKSSGAALRRQKLEEERPGKELAQEPEEEEAEGQQNALVEVQQRSAPAKVCGQGNRAAGTDQPAARCISASWVEGTCLRDCDIAIAKRIEAGREAMIAGLCESPLTLPGYLRSGGTSSTRARTLLRDIIHLDETCTSSARTPPPTPVFVHSHPSAWCRRPGMAQRLPQMQAPAIAPVTPFKPAHEPADSEERAGDGTISAKNLLDDDDMDNWLSVAAIEAELKPKVIEEFAPSPVPTSGCAGCRTWTSNSSLNGCRSRPRRNASMGT